MAWNLLGILSPEARKPGASIHQHSSLGPLAPLAPGVCLLAAQPVPQVARKPGQAGSSSRRLSVDPEAAHRGRGQLRWVKAVQGQGINRVHYR